jgi:hypothetical protein
MKVKLVTYTIPESLDAELHHKIERGLISKFVTMAIWEALKKHEEETLKEFLESDKDSSHKEIKDVFSKIEGEDFIGVEDFDFNDHS